MKKIILLMLSILLVGCSISKTNDKTNEYFNVIGIYYDKINENDNSNEVENLVKVVYEINNTTDVNWEDEFFFGSEVNVLRLGKNTYSYNQSDTSYIGPLYGFKVPGRDTTVWAGTKSIYLASFVVNKNDLKEDMTGQFYVKYNGMEYRYEFGYDDMKNISENQ